MGRNQRRLVSGSRNLNDIGGITEKGTQAQEAQGRDQFVVSKRCLLAIQGDVRTHRALPGVWIQRPPHSLVLI